MKGAENGAPGGSAHPAKAAAEKTLETVLSRIAEPNQATARAYLRLRDRIDKRSIFTRVNDAKALELLAGFLGKPYADADRDDLMAWDEHMEAREYADSSRTTYKSSIKHFYRYLENQDAYKNVKLRRTLSVPERVAWISGHGNGSSKPPSIGSLLTEQDVRRLADACTNPRDRALVMVLYETGGRLAELVMLRIRDVEFDEYGAKVHIREIERGKTVARPVRLVTSHPALRDLINNHPFKQHPDAALFHTRDAARLKHATENNRPQDANMGYKSVNNVLKGIAKRAGLGGKRVNPHGFRHARATALAAVFNEHEQRMMFGWSGSSRMPTVYTSLGGGEAEQKLLQFHGLKEAPKAEDSPLWPRDCPRCTEKNEATNVLCSRCGFPMGPRGEKLVQEKERVEQDVLAGIIRVRVAEEIKRAMASLGREEQR